MELKRGEIPIKRKKLVDYCNCVYKCLRDLDEVMKQPESFDRGKKIALIANRIEFSLDCLNHFQLGTPLNKLKKIIK